MKLKCRNTCIAIVVMLQTELRPSWFPSIFIVKPGGLRFTRHNRKKRPYTSRNQAIKSEEFPIVLLALCWGIEPETGTFKVSSLGHTGRCSVPPPWFFPKAAVLTKQLCKKGLEVSKNQVTIVRAFQSSAEMGEPGKRATISAALIASIWALWVDRMLKRSFSLVKH